MSYLLTSDEICEIGSATVKRIKSVRDTDCYEAELTIAIAKAAPQKLWTKLKKEYGNRGIDYYFLVIPYEEFEQIENELNL